MRSDCLSLSKDWTTLSCMGRFTCEPSVLMLLKVAILKQNLWRLQADYADYVAMHTPLQACLFGAPSFDSSDPRHAWNTRML